MYQLLHDLRGLVRHDARGSELEKAAQAAAREIRENYELPVELDVSLATDAMADQVSGRVTESERRWLWTRLRELLAE